MKTEFHKNVFARYRQAVSTFLWAGFILTFLLGCTGPKYRSNPVFSGQLVGKDPNYDEVTLRVRGGKHTRELEHSLFKMLKENYVYEKVTVIRDNELPTTPLVLEVRIENIREAGWANRVWSPLQSGVRVSGKLIEHNSENILLTFQASRYAQGGPFGHGGYFTAGEESLREEIFGWLAEDIAEKLLAAKGFQGGRKGQVLGETSAWEDVYGR